MITIEESTLFNAPIDAVFDAERNISLHSATQAHRGERAVAGITQGLIEDGQEVEWEAVHFGIRQRMRTRIAGMEKPVFFRTVLVFGAFKSFTHDHVFKPLGDGRTEKLDVMKLEAPLGILGWLAERLFLKAYMTAFLRRKNAELAELINPK